jgi:hypothetical protein
MPALAAAFGSFHPKSLSAGLYGHHVTPFFDRYFFAFVYLNLIQFGCPLIQHPKKPIDARLPNKAFIQHLD